MTRNNLGEHLSWLLNSKLSVPPSGDALPPVSISFTQAEPTQSAAIGAANATTGEEEAFGDLESEEVGLRAPRNQQQEMARLRTEPGSANKAGHVTMGPRLHDDAQPSRLSNPSTSHIGRTKSVSAAPKPTPFSTARQIPQSPQDDVEIMDLTESLGQMQSPDRSRMAGRKRKSSEMERDMRQPVTARAPMRSAEAMPPPPPRGSQQSFTAIDEIMEAPADPPPPYSTLAPSFVSPSKRPAYQAATTSRSSTTFGAEASPMLPDSEDDDDDLIDFSRSRSRTPARKKRSVQKPTAPERIAESPSKPQPASRAESFTLPEKDVEKALRTTFSPDRKTGKHLDNPAGTAAPTPSAHIIGGASSEDQEAVEQFFTLSESEIQTCYHRLNAEYERQLDEVTECIEDDQDPEDAQRLLDTAEERCVSIKDLAGKRERYFGLLEEREQLRAGLKAAIRAKSGQDDAKAAMGACKDKLNTLIRECVVRLDMCKDEVREAMRRKATGEGGRRKVAVQSTQGPPANNGTKQSCVPSSSRIAQTQMVKNERPDASLAPKSAGKPVPCKDSPPNIEAYFSPSRHQSRSAKATSTVRPPARKAIFDEDDDDEFGNVNDSEILEASNHGFSNRMGTPPAVIDDDNEFDDEMMLDFAEDLERSEVQQPLPRSAPSRPPLAQTSGNSQARPSHKSPKRKKRTPSKHDDANLEHLFRFSWSSDVKEALRDRFRLRGFRENQLQAINATLAGKDVFVLMPTGGGKSLCYQLPSLLRSGRTQGVTVVISPLLSLMEDQVNHLRGLGIQAFLINSETPAEKRNAIMHGMTEGNVQDYIQLLYITPEMLSKSQKMVNTFERLYRRQRLARLVIDEAHCVSQWGHDFRPDYKEIGAVRRKFPQVPVMALTATATENVRVDVVHNLGIEGCDIYTSSFNRPNLYYEVRQKPKGKEDVKQIAELIKEKYPRKTGIIYCLSRKNCESMADTLRKEHKIKAHHYHAGLEPEEKREIQKNWQAGVHHVIVATIAFGMGIDKPDVRFVIHHTMPRSLEGYYQETGRAGRDRLPSGCYLFYGYADMGKLRRMIDDGDGDWNQKERQHHMLRKMAQYCDNRSDCRRVQVLRYFNEDFDREMCEGQCDNCCSESSFQTVDFTEYAQKAVRMVGKLAPQKVTLLHCMDVFRGASTKKILEGEHNYLDEYGAGKDLDRGDIERLFYHLLTERAIIEENILNKSGFANQYVQLGRYCTDFRTGKSKLQMQVRSTPKPKAKAPAKKKAKTDPYEEQSKNWKKTAGSRAPAEMPMSTNISSPIQAAAGRKKPDQRRGMHGNGYQRDNFVVSDPDDDEYEEDDDDYGSEGFAPIRVGGQQHGTTTRAPAVPITADDMMNDLDEVHRDAIEQFVRDGSTEARKIMVDRSLRMTPFSDTILRHMAISLTTTQEAMLSIPDINPENVRLYGKKFCKLVKSWQDRWEAIMQPPATGPDPNAQNVIDLVSDEDEESEDEYGDFPSEDEDDEGEASGYFAPPPPSAAVAEFTRIVDQSQGPQGYGGPTPAAKQKKGAKGGKKRTFKATGSNAAPRRKGGFSGGRSGLASYAYDGPSGAGVGKRKASGGGGRKKSAGGGAGSGAGRGAGNAGTSGANRSIISMMPA